MQSEATIRKAAGKLDAALAAGDIERVVTCFDPECEVELLGVRLDGHDGVRRWLDWIFSHVDSIDFTPRILSVDGDTFIEEFEVRGSLPGGQVVNSRWAEILTYRSNLVTSLRLYFDPIDFAPTLGLLGRALGPVATRMARRGLEPYVTIHPADRPVD
jgi:ketosteroid isomerase-like protein